MNSHNEYLAFGSRGAQGTNVSGRQEIENAISQDDFAPGRPMLIENFAKACVDRIFSRVSIKCRLLREKVSHRVWATATAHARDFRFKMGGDGRRSPKQRPRIL